MTALVKIQDHNDELSMMKQLCSIAEKSGSYANMKQDTMLNIMLTAKDLGISPMKALNGGFYVINGKISMSASMMADRIRKAGHSIRITEWTSQKCVMLGIRKDNGDSIKYEFTMEDAVLAGLTNSPTWKKFPKNMLYNRAMSTLARTLFPDVVGNAYSEDEKYDVMNVPPAKRPLEDPDCITLDTTEMTPTNPKITADQVDVLADLIATRVVDVDRMFQAFHLTCLEDIFESDYPKILKALKMKPMKQSEEQ